MFGSRKFLTACICLTLQFFCVAESPNSPIRIGVSLGLTGRLSTTSNHQKNAYQLWEEDINNSGGILGRTIEMIFFDNKSDLDILYQQYSKLILQEKVDFVFGPYSSKQTEIIAPLTEKYGYPTLAAGAAADRLWDQGYTRLFGMWTPATKYTLGMLKLLRFYGINKIMLVHSDSTFATTIARGTKKWANVLRIEVESELTFSDTLSDYTPIAEKIKAVNPHVLIVTGHFHIGYKLKKAITTLGWKPRIYYATVSPTYQKYFNELKPSADFDYSTSIWEPGAYNNPEKSRNFSQRYESRFKKKAVYQAVSAYAAGEVLRDAINQAQTIDRDTITKVLGTLNTTTLLGRYAVDKSGRQLKRFPLIIQWQSGQKKIVWPPSQQTAPPVIAHD